MTDTEFRILQIEDNQDEAELIKDLLGTVRNFSPRLIHFDNLSDGIQYLVDNRYGEDRIDVVLLDLNLPDSSGYDTFERLNQQAPWVPVILMTGIDNEELAHQAVRQGAQDYLLKTDVDGGVLSRAIRYAIERKRGQEALRESQERYMLAIQGAKDGLWDWNLATDRIYFSPRWKSMLGFDVDEIGIQPSEWLDRIHPNDLEGVQFALMTHLNGLNEHFEKEHRILCADGQYKWVLTRGLAVRDSMGVAYRMAGSQTDVTMRKRTEEQLQHDALHDSLTGLPNRALFMDRLGCALERTRRYPDQRFAVLSLDLDRFKIVNDSLGHSAGDQLLVVAGEVLASCLRTGDSVARLGGDEFFILLDKISDISDAVQIAERIQSSLQKPIELEEHKVVISTSIGIIMGTPSYSRSDDILRDADIAMYHAKMRGKACHAIFEPSMRRMAVARMEMENDLRQLLSNPERRENELDVVFQPIVSIANMRLTGFEALLRWNHPQRGPIGPNEFIPVAEETGIIHTLGLWVLRKACEQVRVWERKTAGKPGSLPISINVNISGIQFSRLDLVDQIQTILQENLIPPSSLSLEITESFLIANEGPFQDMMERLRYLGINLQVDDFGRGYSSFSYLQHFPVSTIKIDSLFTQRLGTESNNTEIVSTMVSLARSMGMSVVAEGVETDIQLQKLKEMECPYVQGNFISKPLSGEKAGDYLLQNWALASNSVSAM
jgi:diguanylate cyclase (GGDEF)-like protein/PAS domain S-box-containing protein